MVLISSVPMDVCFEDQAPLAKTQIQEMQGYGRRTHTPKPSHD